MSPLLALYRDDFSAFGPFVKDFVRSSVFPEDLETCAEQYTCGS